ncbi:hypothetical protein RJT34_11495 [Clitoria ternatea]|uniref:Protein XRI1 n=1 Tax=Clitoria ternatea TaxID=43366 RepID=A0AAN9PKK2_CLITE
MSQSHHNNLCSDYSSSMELEIGVTHTDLLLESWFQSDTSSGYLEDAITGKAILCKEHKLPSCFKVDQFPTSSMADQPLHDYCFTHHKNFISATNLSSSSSSQSDTHEGAIKHDHAWRSYASKDQSKKIVYPFELVKPGGVEGETTLKDINHQIVMSPSASKAIPHPVEDSMTHPCTLTRDFGLSGKVVTSLTRIHTRGRGSITIIRTKN